MSFKIINTEVVEETICTDVEYTFKDGTIIVTRVAHFNPENKMEIMENIRNRGISERQKKNIEEKNKLLLTQIEQDIIFDADDNK